MLSRRRVMRAFFIIIAAVLVFSSVLDKPQAKAPDQSTLGTGAATAETEARSRTNAPLPVRVVEARRGELIIRLRSPGEAATERMVRIKTEVGGVVTALLAREGLHVKAGDRLAALDDTRYRLALARQEATRLRLLSEMLLESEFERVPEPLGAESRRVARAREEFAGAESAWRAGLISRAEFEKAVKDYEIALIDSGMKKEEIRAASKGLTQAEVDVKTAELDLEKTVIRAPFAGVVTGLQVSPGEPADPGRELFTLVDIQAVKVIARVLESEVGKIQAGRAVDLRFSAYPDRVFRGAVEAVSPVVSPEDKTCAVHIAVENPGEEIKPGMHAEVEIAAEVHPDRLLVPRDAVLVRGGRALVFVVEDGLAKWRYVEVGLENDSFAEILDGVRDGEKVIVEGHFTLAHDAPVSIT